MGTTEPRVQRTLAELVRPGDVVWDVGAQVGFFAALCARLVGKAGQLYAFDPLAANQAAIAANARLNRFTNIRVIGCAVGETDGEIGFTESADSLLGRAEGLGEPRDTVRHFTVACRSVDSLVENDNLQLPNVIKIDVEGFEEFVLRGARRTIESCRPLLLIELHGTNANVRRVLKDLGYIGYVLDSGSEEIDAAAWDAHIIAASAYDTENRERCRAVSKPTDGN